MVWTSLEISVGGSLPFSDTNGIVGSGFVPAFRNRGHLASIFVCFSVSRRCSDLRRVRTVLINPGLSNIFVVAYLKVYAVFTTLSTAFRISRLRRAKTRLSAFLKLEVSTSMVSLVTDSSASFRISATASRTRSCSVVMGLNGPFWNVPVSPRRQPGRQRRGSYPHRHFLWSSVVTPGLLRWSRYQLCA